LGGGMKFQTRMLHAFRPDRVVANRLAVVIGAAGGAGLEEAARLADSGFDLVIVDTTAAIFSVGGTLMREANRVTAQNVDPASVEDAERLLDSLGDRAIDILSIHGADAPGTRHVVEVMTDAMRRSGRGRILVGGSEVFAAT